MKIATRNDQHSRRGHTLLIAVTVLVICSAIIMSLTRTALQRYAFADRLLLKTQADCIAESAIIRADHELVKDPMYTGEQWSIDSLPEEVGVASADILVSSETIHVVVTLPNDAPATHQIRVERQRPIAQTNK